MKLNRVCKCMAIVFFCVLLCGQMLSCGKKTDFSIDQFERGQEKKERIYTFDAEDRSAAAQYDAQKLKAFAEWVRGITVEYGYEEFFDYSAAMQGIYVDHAVEQHRFCALDESGKLTKEYLCEIVKENTSRYLEDSRDDLIRPIEDEALLLRFCEIIVESTNEALQKVPSIDRARVLCNLGNLKIVERAAATDLAAVEPGMVLHVNRNMANMYSIMSKNGMYFTMVHETMHILQFGCTCEQIPNCKRRCGLAHAYIGQGQDFSDWTWLAEASAEQMAALLLDQAPKTYRNMVGYLLTMDLCTMLQKNVPANYAETLSFGYDPEPLFDLFGCSNETERQELYHAMYALEMIQQEPQDFKDAFAKLYGKEFADETAADFKYRIKRPVVLTFAKRFYENLAATVAEEALTENDILFLLTLLDSTLNYHINFGSENEAEYNAEFEARYRALRDAFFDCFSGIDEADYAAYTAKGENGRLCAGMQWLPNEKQRFLTDKYEGLAKEYKFLSQP